MFILLLLTTVTSSNGEAVVCDGVVFNNKYYDKEVLFLEPGQAYNLVAHEISEQLIFSRTARNEDYSYRRFVSCHIKTRICNDINGAAGGNAVFYHRGNNDLYLGTYDGIYQYDFNTKSANLVLKTGNSIWGLFVSNTQFYYISYPEKKLYVHANNAFKIVKELTNVQVENFFVSKSNVVYFSNTTALYRVENHKPFDAAILLNDRIIVRQIVDDLKGNVYFSASDGVYMDDAITKQLKKVSDIGAYGMTLIDLTSSKGYLNIIYSVSDAIYKLEPSKNSEDCFNEGKNKTFGFSIELNVKNPHNTRKRKRYNK